MEDGSSRLPESSSRSRPGADDRRREPLARPRGDAGMDRSFWLSVPPPRPGHRSPSKASADAHGCEPARAPRPADVMLDSNRIIVANAAAREAIGTSSARMRGSLPPSGGSRPARARRGQHASIKGYSGRAAAANNPAADRRALQPDRAGRPHPKPMSAAHTGFVANASHEPHPAGLDYRLYGDAVEGGEAIEAKRAAGSTASCCRRQTPPEPGRRPDVAVAGRGEKHDQPRAKVKLAALVGLAALDGAGPDRQERLDTQDRRGSSSCAAIANGSSSSSATWSTTRSSTVARCCGHDQVERGGRRWQCEPSATGEGIAPEHPHLHPAIYRTDPGRSRAVTGDRTDLAIVKHIVERAIAGGWTSQHGRRGRRDRRLPLAD